MYNFEIFCSNSGLREEMKKEMESFKNGTELSIIINSTKEKFGCNMEVRTAGNRKIYCYVK